MKPLRILHFSDIHLPYPPRAWHTPAMLHQKRFLAAVNYLLRRRHHYAAAYDQLSALHAFLDAHPVDFIFYTGDSTNAGLESEFVAAAPRVRDILRRAGSGFVAVPGNHDLYTPASVAAYRRHFDFAEPPARPVLVPLAANAMAIAISSARPHFPVWDSSGTIPREELDALATLLARPGVQACPNIFLLLHYPPADRDFFHGFRSANDLAQVLEGHPNVIVLHGHQHRRSSSVLPGGQRVFCAGSLTSRGKAGFWLYELDGNILVPTAYRYASAAFYPETPSSPADA